MQPQPDLHTSRGIDGSSHARQTQIRCIQTARPKKRSSVKLLSAASDSADLFASASASANAKGYEITHPTSSVGPTPWTRSDHWQYVASPLALILANSALPHLVHPAVAPAHAPSGATRHRPDQLISLYRHLTSLEPYPTYQFEPRLDNLHARIASCFSPLLPLHAKTAPPRCCWLPRSHLTHPRTPHAPTRPCRALNTPPATLQPRGNYGALSLPPPKISARPARDMSPSTSLYTAPPPSLTAARLPPSPRFRHPAAAVSCFKPLPSVPKDVDADYGLDDDGSELVLQPRPSLTLAAHADAPIESDISTASPTSTASSSMQADWHETSLRNQVAKLSINYTDLDLTLTEQPSVFGLRRRIVAAALDHVAQRPDVPADQPRQPRQFHENGLGDWLSAQPPSSSQWKDRILRKKKSFGLRSSTKAAKAQANAAASIHASTLGSASIASDGGGARSRSGSVTGSTSSHEKMLRRDKELAQREADFDLVVLSRFETAELRMTVYTEHRRGSWVVQGPASAGDKVLDEPPLVFSPWDCQIDSCAIVERKKLRSFIELSDTTCAVRCTTCSSAHRQRLGHEADDRRVMACRHCQGTGAVKTTYVVCVTLRQTSFLPLMLPARHRAGKHQDAFRPYLPRTSVAMSHVDVLRMRSLEAVRTCALRVGRVHWREHDARLLVAKAVLERRSCNSVAVINRTNGRFRTFDITDGGFVRGNRGAGLVEEESRITETAELTEALARLPITALVHPEATHRFVDLELVDMARSKELSIELPSGPNSPSIRTFGSSTDGSYSPSAFSFFQRAGGAGETARSLGDASHDASTQGGSWDRTLPHAGSNDSRRTADEAEIPRSGSVSRWQLPPLDLPAATNAPIMTAQPPMHAEGAVGNMSAVRKPWTKYAPSSPSLSAKSVGPASAASSSRAGLARIGA